MSQLLEGRVALVTGAGHGIGRAHALELARHGARVVVNDLGGSVSGEGAGRDAQTVADIITARGGEAVADFGNVADEAAADAMVARGIEQWGRLDIVVNNAGIVRDRAIWNMDVADFDLVMNVHVRGSWLTSRAAARHWRAVAKEAGGTTYGRVINTVSGAGLLGNFGQSNYATAKAGIMGLTLTLSLELAGIGVTVNAISPGAITRLSATTMPGATPREADEREGEEFDPLGPGVSSPIVAWLASPEAERVSGQCLRAMREDLQLLKGWSAAAAASNGGKAWDAAKVGRTIDTQLFGTRAAGLSLGG
ncbi:MAG TPA: SDR family NAD(P)-dependent oxidoreductase [Mycobacteriales bacterium]|nr:SDR family NAD(P)-dependent oxidoreductase [Mycobacteriales bacterium]